MKTNPQKPKREKRIEPAQKDTPNTCEKGYVRKYTKGVPV
jgi:hypothetical protein